MGPCRILLRGLAEQPHPLRTVHYLVSLAWLLVEAVALVRLRWQMLLESTG